MEEMVQQALSKGVEMHVAGEFELASQLYGSVIKLDPNHADANHNMGLLKVDTGDALEALPYLQIALQADTSVAQFWLSYIKALIQLDRMDEASKVLSLAQESGAEGEEFLELHQQLNEPTVEVEPVQSEADTSSQSNQNILDTLNLDKALRLAKTKVKEGSPEETKRIYQDILEKFPKNKQAQQGLTVLNKPKQSAVTHGPPQYTINQLINLYNQGQLKAVVEQAQALTQQYPEAFIVWNILGAANKGLGRVGEASEAFKKVTELKPHYADGHNNFGATLHDQGKLEEAIAAYKQALSLKPDYADAYYNMGVTLKDLGELEEAITSYEKALSLKPDHPEAHYNMGVTLQDQGKLDEAVTSFETALSLKPDYANAYNNMGNALKDQGKLEEAIASYKKALSFEPKHAQAYNNMAIVLSNQDKFAEAVEAYIQALFIKPDYTDAYYNLGNSFKDLGKLEEAIEAYNKALTLKPDFFEAYLNALEILKVYSSTGEKRNVLFDADKKVRAIGKKITASSSQKEIVLNLSKALEHVNEYGFNFKTTGSQIFKRNSVDLNCGRHTKVFYNSNIIPEFCFGCFKVQVEVDDLLSLIRLTSLFYSLCFGEDLIRKTLIEMRPEIPGFYKGLVYCRGLEQARHVKDLLDVNLKDIFNNKVISHIKRGCSEFPIKFPEYGKIDNDRTVAMQYPIEWKSEEEKFDQDDLIKPKKNVIPSLSEFCLSDFYIIQKWIDYARGLDDPSCKWFKIQPIVFNEVYEIAAQRKIKLGKVFTAGNTS